MHANILIFALLNKSYTDNYQTETESK